MTIDPGVKIFFDLGPASAVVDSWKNMGFEVVFTNGCFDIFHPGHLRLLQEAAKMGDKLIVGLNSDPSVKKLKGESRPILKVDDRAMILASIIFVDMVVVFEEETPQSLIEALVPDVLIKGGDYKLSDIVGSDIVINHGGTVRIVDLVKGFSTSKIIDKIK